MFSPKDRTDWGHPRYRLPELKFAYFIKAEVSLCFDLCSLWPHELQHARPPCPSPAPGIYPKRRGLGLINCTSECRMHTKRQGCVLGQMTLSTENSSSWGQTHSRHQATGSSLECVPHPEVVLGAEKEIPTVMQGSDCVWGLCRRGHSDAAFVGPCPLPKRILPIPGSTWLSQPQHCWCHRSDHPRLGRRGLSCVV